MRVQIYSLLNYRLFLVFCFVIQSLLACNKKQSAYIPPFIPPSSNSDTPKPVAKYLALGDSYTIGQNVDINDRFPYQTVARLQQMNKLVNVPDYIATTGWTTANLLQGIASANKPKNYDIVSLLIGVNNQYQGKDTGEYRIQFAECLEKAIEQAGGRKSRVFVLSIPDYSVTPFGRSQNPTKISREIDWFNAINEQVTKSKGIVYINITPGSRAAATFPSLVANDGLHPSGEEYKKWADQLVAKIAEVL